MHLLLIYGPFCQCKVSPCPYMRAEFQWNSEALRQPAPTSLAAELQGTDFLYEWDEFQWTSEELRLPAPTPYPFV